MREVRLLSVLLVVDAAAGLDDPGELDWQVMVEAREWLDEHPKRAERLAGYLERLASWVRDRRGPFPPMTGSGKKGEGRLRFSQQSAPQGDGKKGHR